MELDRPIFVIGTGRSGSTAFFHAFCLHPELAWLTGALNRFPGALWVNRMLLFGQDVPLVGDQLVKNGRLGGGEVYDFWRRHVPNFDRSPRDLVAADVKSEIKASLPSLLSKTLTPRRPRLMTKLTGWSRIGYLLALFPDARFIHVVRDGRAVATSFFNVSFWRGHQGPDHWRWGPLSSAQMARWEAVDREIIGLAGLNWEILMDATAKAADQLPNEQYFEIRYEDLCRHPLDQFKAVVEFCDLSWSLRFENYLSQINFVNRNDGYKHKLSPRQLDALETILAESLQRYGYSPQPSAN
ncbi:MAG: sulfotransferase [Chloroflexota bacterium]